MMTMQTVVLTAVTAVPLLGASLHTPAAPAGLEPKKTYAVIVGMLGTASAPDWDKENRKDQELFDTLARKGVPTNNMAIILDEQATPEGARTALSNVLQQTTPDSTFIFYFTGHGGPGVCFTYREGFNVSEITVAVKKLFKGRNILLMADCCHSGGLGVVANDLAAAGFRAASLTSADVTVISIGDWTFSQTLLAALNGDVVFDEDHDGFVTLGEAAAEVALAMEYRAHQLYGFTLAGLPESWHLAATNGAPVPRGRAPGSFRLKQYVNAPCDNEKQVGRIVGWDQGKYRVEFLRYSDKTWATCTPDQLDAISFKRFATGTTVAVSHHRETLPATVVKVQNDFHLVRYVGWPGNHEEWVLSNRILGDAADHPPQKDLVFVEWHGTWWLAKIKKTDARDKRYFIHYVGDSDNWDEWVTDARMKRAGDH